jgi:hypothetical protein
VPSDRHNLSHCFEYSEVGSVSFTSLTSLSLLDIKWMWRHHLLSSLYFHLSNLPTAPPSVTQTGTCFVSSL